MADNNDKSVGELTEQKRKELEKEEEVKLKKKMPDLKGGCSQLLQKRLSKGNKYFDSGDYNMAKAKTAGGGKFLGQKPPLLIGQTGDTIATPETVPHKKLGTQTSKLAEAS